MELADKQQREQALAPQTSFIVQAPAGSGKTELLVQRFLVLLAHTEQAPEEIVAITFTRKAAAEMRDRIIQALQSAADSTTAPAAHHIKTHQLAKSVLQRNQALQWHLLENPNRLQINTIDSLCLSLVRQMPSLLKLGAPPKPLLEAEDHYRQAVRRLWQLGNQESYMTAWHALLAHLDNHYEKAESLLIEMLAHRDQWLPHLLGALKAKNTNELRAILQQGLANLVSERLQKCQQLFPALPGLELPPPTLGEQARWQKIAKFFLTQDHQWRQRVTKKEALLIGDSETFSDLLKELRQGTYEDLRQALADVCELPPTIYSEEQWQVLDALIELLPLLAAELHLIFQEQGSMDFVGITGAALEALGKADAPSQLALYLDYQIRHLLVDEFQDTSLTQFRLLELLTAGWQPDDGRTLFLVGDPMQSIYRFRQAEVGLFLRARRQGIGAIPLKSLVLTANFRSSPHLITWFNQAFNTIFPKVEDIAAGAIDYAPCTATKNDDTQAGVHIYPLLTAQPEAEAMQVAQLAQSHLQNHPHQTIAIMVRSRSHLQTIVPALQQAGLPFQAVEIEKLHTYSIIDDLLALTRALWHLADRTAWLAVLRAPWCGLTLADLHILANQQPHHPLWQVLTRYQEITHLSQDAQQRLQRCVPILAAALQTRERNSLRQWVEGTWWALGGPACLTEESELARAQIYFNLLDEIVQDNSPFELTKLEQKLQQKYATPVQSASARLQVMTIHKAKGLEFDVVILPGLDRKQRQEESRLLLWMERPRLHGDSDLVLAPIHAAGEKDAIYEYLRAEQKRKEQYEAVRLLYVAATRARQHLYLLGRAQPDFSSPNAVKKPVKGSFLELLWPVVQQDFTTQLHATNTQKTTTPAPTPTLYRLKADWQLPTFTPKPTTFATPTYNEIPVDAEITDTTARIVGIVVHQTLQKISQDGLNHWTESKLVTYRKTWRKLLIELGLSLTKLDEALVTIAAAIRRTLADPRGRWLLDHRHEDAHSEYSLTAVLQQQPVHLIIDRTFIAEGTRWIVDYKTATPTDDNLAAFLTAQQQQYQAQLRRYAQAMGAYDAQRPIRLGLYFPLCSGWQEWAAEEALLA